jgi:hypothetical protein
MLKGSGACWAVSDGAAGNRRQALALAERLGLPVRELAVDLRAPWSWLAPRLAPGARHALRPPPAPPWPELVVGCGRAAALFTRLVRRASHGASHAVQILDPRIDPRHWDLVVAPRHDRLAGPNVLAPLGSLNPVDEAWLAAGRAAFPALAALPAPRVGVLLGGPRRGVALDEAYVDALAAGLLARWRREGGSVLALASRRTPPVLAGRLRAALGGVPGSFWADDRDGANPYQGVLGWAGRLVATPDSVNMLSEACAVGCAVHTLVAGSLPAKLERFHAALRQAGLLHDLDADAPLRQPPLRETEGIAAAVRARLAPRAGES